MITDHKRLANRCKRYGLTIDQFIAMLYVQNFRCRICDDLLVIEGTGQSAVDHCHATGKVRGILCADCNLLLGRIEAKGVSRFVDHVDRHFNVGAFKSMNRSASGKRGRPKLERPMTSTERSRKRREEMKARKQAD